METIEKVNFHYEYQLAGIGLPDSQIQKINREYEYAALLWGGVEALANYQSYTADYLKKCEELGEKIPVLKEGSKEYDRHFWGELSSKLEVLNSKKTSSQIGADLGLNQKEVIFHELNELKLFLEKQNSCPYIIRTDYSVSGRGVFIHRPEDELKPLLKRLEKEQRGQHLIASPYLNRVKDFSVIMERNRPDIVYETMVDNRGKFCGVLIDNEKINSLDQWMSQKDIEVFRSIFNRYQKLGAQKIQIDGFYYKEGGELKVFHLAEVNVRKTMGELAYRLFKRKYSSSPYFCFSLLSSAQRKNKRSRSNKELLISPQTSEHALYISVHDEEDEARWYFL